MYSASQREIGKHDYKMRMEVGRSFLTTMQRANATCSRWVYQVSTVDKDLLVNNKGSYFRFSSSLSKVALIEASETTS